MRLLASELDVELNDRKPALVDDVVVGGVDHHRCRGVGERSCIDQIDLSPVCLFGRGAEHGDSNTEVIDQRCHGES